MQSEALEILKTGVNVFLTGEPGSGKTHTVNAYVQYLRDRGVALAITASTGIAATHIGGQTIHSWSGIGVKKDINDYDIENIREKEKTARRIIDAKVLIIDEISMLDAATIASVDRVLRNLRRKPMQEEEPFGGLQVVFVGDFFQLPPVSKGERTQFSFGSTSWKEANPVVCYLSEQHRQADGELLDILAQMRRGSVSPAHRNVLRARIGKMPEQLVTTRLYTHNADVDRINVEQLRELSTDSHTFFMQTSGAKALVDILQSNCLSPNELVLKEGAAVMFTRNNFEVGYVNGTLGTVEAFDDSGAPLVRTRNGNLIGVEAEEWAMQDGNMVLAKLIQLPLRLAWAITVHKSQGMSLDAAIIDLGAAFEYGQGYVALSRVRSLGGLFLVSMSERALMLHPEVIAKDEEFHKRSALAQTRFARLSVSDKSNMQENFLRAIGGKAPLLEQSEKKESNIGQRAKQRETYPSAGKPWASADDKKLQKMFENEVSEPEIAEKFGRKPSAIHARLAHLGLVEDYWAKKQGKRKKN